MSAAAKVASSRVATASSSATKTEKSTKVVTVSSSATETEKSTKVVTVSSSATKTERGVKPIKGRRGTLYHLSSIKEDRQTGNATLADVKARRRFATNRYFLSPAGILKLLVIILFVVAGTLFLTSEFCAAVPSWYTWLYPLACLIVFISTVFLYVMFMLGMAEDNPSFWVTLDLVLTLTEAAAIIAISIVTITESQCSSQMSETVLAPLGLAGAALMVVSAAVTYIMWRYSSQEPPDESSNDTDVQQTYRKSVFI